MREADDDAVALVVARHQTAPSLPVPPPGWPVRRSATDCNPPACDDTDTEEEEYDEEEALLPLVLVGFRLRARERERIEDVITIVAIPRDLHDLKNLDHQYTLEQNNNIYMDNIYILLYIKERDYLIIIRVHFRISLDFYQLFYK